MIFFQCYLKEDHTLLLRPVVTEHLALKLLCKYFPADVELCSPRPSNEFLKFSLHA